MLNFDLFMPPRIIFGPGRLAELAQTAYLSASRWAMIVVGAALTLLAPPVLSGWAKAIPNGSICWPRPWEMRTVTQMPAARKMLMWPSKA